MSMRTPLVQHDKSTDLSVSVSNSEDEEEHLVGRRQVYLDAIHHIVDRDIIQNITGSVLCTLEGRVFLGFKLNALLAVVIFGGSLLMPFGMLCWVVVRATHIPWDVPHLAYLGYFLVSICLAVYYVLPLTVELFGADMTDLARAEVLGPYGIGFVGACLVASDILHVIVATAVGEQGLTLVSERFGGEDQAGKMMYSIDVFLEVMKELRGFRFNTGGRRVSLVPQNDFEGQFCQKVQRTYRSKSYRGIESERDFHEKDFVKMLCYAGDQRLWVYGITAVHALLPGVWRVAHGKAFISAAKPVAALASVLFIAGSFQIVPLFFKHFLGVLLRLKIHRLKLSLVIYYAAGISAVKFTLKREFMPDFCRLIPNPLGPNFEKANQIWNLLHKERHLGSEKVDACLESVVGRKTFQSLSVSSFLDIRRLQMVENNVLRVVAQYHFAGLVGGAVAMLIFGTTVLGEQHNLDNASITLAIFDILVLLCCAAVLFDRLAKLSTTMTTTSNELVDAWKQRVHSLHWEVQGELLRAGLGPMSPERVQLDNYFASIISPYDHLSWYLQQKQLPMSVFGIPVTVALQKQIALAASPFIFSRVCNVLKQQAWLQHLLHRVHLI